MSKGKSNRSLFSLHTEPTPGRILRTYISQSLSIIQASFSKDLWPDWTLFSFSQRQLGSGGRLSPSCGVDTISVASKTI